jgi:hypothetical protein
LPALAAAHPCAYTGPRRTGRNNRQKCGPQKCGP